MTERIQAPSNVAKLYVYAPKKYAEEPEWASACKTLAYKEPVASRRETTSTQLDPSSEALLQPIQFQQKNAVMASKTQ